MTAPVGRGQTLCLARGEQPIDARYLRCTLAVGHEGDEHYDAARHARWTAADARDARGALAATNLPPQPDRDWTGVLPGESDDASPEPCCDGGPAGHTEQQHHDASPCYDHACRFDHPRGGPFPRPRDTPATAGGALPTIVEDERIPPDRYHLVNNAGEVLYVGRLDLGDTGD